MENSKEEKKPVRSKDSNININLEGSKDAIDKPKTSKKKHGKKVAIDTSIPSKENEEKTKIKKAQNICDICKAKDVKLFTFNCDETHSICFKCIFEFFMINMNIFLQEKSNKNNKKTTLIKCPICYNISNKGEIEFKNPELLSLIEQQIKNGFLNDNQLNHKCEDHESVLNFYCDQCNSYICKLCCRYEHQGHKFVTVKDKCLDIINKINNRPYKIKDVKDFMKKIENINENNLKNFNEIYNKTMNEIEKCENSLNNLKQTFKNVMDKNIKYYETYSKIISISFENYYNEIKNLNANDCNINHLNTLNELNDELNNINIIISQTVFQEVESTRKKFENLCCKEKITSTIKFSSYFDRIKDFTCEQTITDHTNYINEIIINKEDNKIITSCDDTNIRIFDVNQNYKCIQILKGHTGPITKMKYLLQSKNEGTKLLSGSEDDTIKIWEMKNNNTYEFKCINTLKGHGGSVNLFALINNDEGINEGKFASAAGDMSIRIWDPKGDYKNCIVVNNCHFGKITDLKVYRNNKFLLSSSEDKNINIYNLKDDNCNILYKIKEHSDKINGLFLFKFILPNLNNQSIFNNISNNQIKEKDKENESISNIENKDKENEKDKEKIKTKKSTKNQKSSEKGLSDKLKTNEKSIIYNDKIFLISNSLDCNICVFDMENKFTLLFKEKIHKMGIRSMIQTSEDLFISISLDKSIAFWNLSVVQEKIEEIDEKDKKKQKKKEEPKEGTENNNNSKDKEKDKDKESSNVKYNLVIKFCCIGVINDLKWLTNTVLFYDYKKTIYVGNQDKTIKIYRITNYENYLKNKDKLILKNVGSMKGHDREITLIQALGDKIISVANDFKMKIWEDN